MHDTILSLIHLIYNNTPTKSIPLEKYESIIKYIPSLPCADSFVKQFVSIYLCQYLWDNPHSDRDVYVNGYVVGGDLPDEYALAYKPFQ